MFSSMANGKLWIHCSLHLQKRFSAVEILLLLVIMTRSCRGIWHRIIIMYAQQIYRQQNSSSIEHDHLISDSFDPFYISN